MSDAEAHVDDAHSSIREALSALDEISLTDLNETEREHVLNAIADLYDADEAIAVRSGIDTHPKSRDVHGNGGDA